MNLIGEYQNILEKKINELQFPSEPGNLYDPLRYFLTLGGKRTRPVLTLLGCQLFGEPGIKAINAAIAVELFHNFTLIHDDIMDEAPLRRGKVTVHEKWNSNIGILSGDVLFVEAYKFLAHHDTDVLPDLLEIFSRTAREVCEGQQMDMDFEVRGDVSLEEYLEMIRLKTSVLLGAALEMGAVIAKADKENVAKIYQFGVNVGLAFQLQDDILDLYADPDKFGKQVGGDILSNKKTFLLITAMNQADSAQKKHLEHIMNSTAGNTKVEEAKELFNELKVREFAREKMDAYYQKALSAMNEIGVPKENKLHLLGLADYLMKREN
ncbi:MAG: polyprenyl synthetase family protein [Brumimicrobium sp.]|nr:polyprenyl synthetase family protein [Brumimicrobium sp.]